MKPSSCRQLRKSQTLKDIGGISTLKKFRAGGPKGTPLMPLRARAFLLAKISSELGKPERAKRMAGIAVNEYLFHHPEGTDGKERAGSYTLAKKAADIGGIGEAELALMVREAAERHMQSGSIMFAMGLAVDAGLPDMAEEIARRFQTISMFNENHALEIMLTQVYLMKPPTKENVREASISRIDRMRKEGGKSVRRNYKFREVTEENLREALISIVDDNVHEGEIRRHYEGQLARRSLPWVK